MRFAELLPVALDYLFFVPLAKMNEQANDAF
jgi:hypothetical protein